MAEFTVADKLILIVIAMLTICLDGSLNAVGNYIKYEEKKYEVYIREISNSFAEQMDKELNLHGFGNFRASHDIVEVLGMNFTARRRATIQEARALTLLVIDKFVHAINTHENIQPYLAEHPFTHKRIRISIDFNGPKGSYADGSVTSVFYVTDLSDLYIHRTDLLYHANDPIKQSSILLLKESYGEAVKLNAASPVENPGIHQTTKKEEAIDTAFELFCEKMREDHGIYCWSIGGKMADDIKNIGAKFTAFQPATKEEARQLLVEVAEKLLSEVNNDEKLRPYLAKYPFPLNRLKLLIRFRTEGYDSYLDGSSMEDIELLKEQITYFQRIVRPNKNVSFIDARTVIVAKEPYQEAKKIVEQAPLPKKDYKSHPHSPSLSDYIIYWIRASYVYFSS